MDKGWDATGRLKKLWDRLPGGRDGLARLTGIRGPTLSNYNAGSKNLGPKNAERIVAVVNEHTELRITIYDLGAPASAGANGNEPTVLLRLAAVEEAAQRLAAGNRRLARRVRDLERRVRGEDSPGAVEPGGRPPV